MAPSNMFSYLRPGHAKRNASSLPAPEPVAGPALAPPHSTEPPISPFPPQLPPIARVASKLDKTPSDRGLLSPLQRTQHQLPPSYEDNLPSMRPATGASPAPAPYLAAHSHSTTHLAPSISPSYAGFSRSQTSLISGISEKLSSSSKGASTPTAVPKAKSRLNLRNPMSLLMRRRSGQTLDPLSDDALVTHRSSPVAPSMPDNYDPSIRGNIVHDFNAPRLNRNFSYSNAYGAGEAPQDLGRVSPQKIDKEHTPVFREHFDDDTSYEQSQAAIRAETLVNRDFLARNSVQFTPPAKSPPPPPPVPKDSPPATLQTFTASVLSPVQESPNLRGDSIEVTPPRKIRSTRTPPVARSRATSVTDPSFQPAGLPAHFSSRASRFSFQIPGGSDSAQEKLLEERHKEKEAQKASKQVRVSTNTIADEYEEYDMDDYDMDGGFDEEIPMLGEEEEFEGLGNQTLDSNIGAFDFSAATQSGLQAPMIPMNALGQFQMPVDMNGNPIGFAMSEEMLQQFQALGLNAQPGLHGVSNTDTHGLGLSSQQEDPKDLLEQSLHTKQDASHSRSTNHIDMDDDMYFDDGLIGDQDDQEVAEFNEDVFDDPEGPLYERKVKFSGVDDTSNTLSSLPNTLLSPETGYEADDDTMFKHLEKSEPSLAHKTSAAQQRSVPTFDNMDAYHSALADAATRAEATGRFTRKASVDAGPSGSDADAFSSLSNSRPSLVPDDGRFDLDTDVFPPDDDLYGMSSQYVDDYDYSDFDSAMEDDPIIAAANAEALAYDDEGFYGQEFGFYAAAAGESTSAWGGYFGSSGLGRAPSGRNAVREPNLTPITERSEYSTRNSFISINHFRDGQQPLSSPGLAQLARMSPYGWPDSTEDMSLDALMKLRKGAFGGSVASLPGSVSNSPRNSSPMGMQFVPRASSAAGNRMMPHNDYQCESDESGNNVDNFEHDEANDEGLMDAVNGTHEDEDREYSDDQERSESPTLMASDYDSPSSPTGHAMGNDAPLLPPISELYAQHNMQFPSHMSPPMSPGGLNLTSAANVSLPMSPYGMPLSSPYTAQQRPPAPPSIDTSLSSPAATVSSSSAPRRQSMGFVSPISNSSPITPSGSGWRASHSRKGSAADSVTYVREHDEQGEGRWVLERRRTAESGELELIGREIVEGGRI